MDQSRGVRVKTEWTPESLLAFEAEIAAAFERGEIRSPVHLAGGNEQALIDIFASIAPSDWVLCAWRSHYHCLLKGVPPEELKTAIFAGHSIALSFEKQKILCSAIVGGTAPIAMGIAWSLKRHNDIDPTGNEAKVHCFLGDMTAETGIVHECMKYADRHSLPIRWIIEDNGKSVCTPTQEVWGYNGNSTEVVRYQHELSRPHCGIGKYVRF